MINLQRCFLLLLLISMACIGSPVIAEDTTANTEQNRDLGSCQTLGKSIAKCKKMTCSMPHPNQKDEKIYHEILGFSGDELLCHHTQTIPKGGMIDCKYPKIMRKILAKQFDAISPLPEDEVKVITESFPLYCEVIQ